MTRAIQLGAVAVVAVAVAIALALTGWWHAIIRDPAGPELGVAIFVDGDPAPLVPSPPPAGFSPVAAFPDGRSTMVRVATSHPADVELLANGLLAQNGRTDDSGDAVFDGVPLHPGVNLIEARATSSRPWGRTSTASFQAFDEVHYAIDENGNKYGPVLLPLATVVNAPAFVVRGTSPDPNQIVALQIVGSDPANSGSGTVNADANGYFEGTITFAAPDQYTLTATAQDSENAPASPPSEPVTVTYDPSATPTEMPRASRKLRATVGYRDLRVDLQTTLPRNDPRAIFLVTGQLPFDQFLQLVYGDTRIGDLTLDNLLLGIPPALTLSDTSLTVTASTRPLGFLLPLSEGTLVVAGRGPPLGIDTDESFTAIIADYSAVSFDPPPTSFDGYTATWSGVGSVATDQRPVAMRVSTSPLASVNHAAIALRTPPGESIQFPPSIADILIFIGTDTVRKLVGAFSLMWVLWTLQRHTADFERKNPPVRTAVYWLLGLVLAPVLGGFVSAGASPVMPGMRSSLATVGLAMGPLVVLSPALVILLSLAIALLIAIRALSSIGRDGWTWVVRQILHGALRGVIIELPVLSLGVIVGSLPLTSMGVQIVFTLFFVVLLIVVFRFAGRLLNDAGIALRRVSTLARLALLAVLILLVYPATRLNDLVSIRFGLNVDPVFEAAADVSGFMSAMTAFIPLAGLLVLLVVLRSYLAVAVDRERLVVMLGAVFFAGYVISTRPVPYLLPVPFILAILVYWRILLAPEQERKRVASVAEQVRSNPQRFIQSVLAAWMARDLDALVDELRKKMTKGEISPTSFEQRADELQAYSEEQRRRSRLRNGEPAQRVALGIAPRNSDWDNGVWAAGHAAWLAIPFACIELLQVAGPIASSQRSYVALILFGILTTSLVYWLGGAFFFGYYYNRIAGNSGLQKGLRTGLMSVLCLLPIWLVSLGDAPWAVLLLGLQVMCFFLFVSVWAFDLHMVRSVLGDRFRWPRMFDVWGMGSLATGGSIVVGSVGVAITAVVTNQAKSIVTLLLGSILPQLNQPH